MIEEEKLKEVLKEIYLEIVNGYDISDLHHDSDKVACVASRFRSMVLKKLNIVSNEKEGRKDRN